MRSRRGIRSTIFVIIAVFIIFAFCGPMNASAAAEQPKKGGMLIASTPTDLISTDPHLGNSSFTGEVMNHIFETLVGFGTKMEFVPVLAERWVISKDYKTYTFYLRKGKLFHNGREMVADDVKYSLDRVMDPKTKCPRAADFTNAIESVNVKDKYTVVINMKKENAGFLYLLANTYPIIAIVPKEEIEKQGGVFKQPIGTGPYKFVEWKPDRYVLLERFDQYKPQPGPRNGMGGERIALLDKIRWNIIKEDSVVLMSLLNKEIDMVRIFPVSYIDKFQQEYSKQGLVMHEIPGLGTVNLFFSCDKPITNNVKFRQAVAYGVDVQALAKAARYGSADVNVSMMVPENPFWTPYHKTWYKKDANKAKQLLQEAGYKGEEITIDTTRGFIEYYRLTVALQAELKELGINSKLNVLEYPALLKKFYDDDFQILIQAVIQPDPVLAYAFYKVNKFDDVAPKMVEIRDKASKTLDVKQRQKLFEEAHKLQYEYVPAISVHQPNMFTCRRDYVKGFVPHPSYQMWFWGVWLDK